MFGWRKRDWLFRVINEKPPIDFQNLNRTYYFRNNTAQEPAKWKWSEKFLAPTVLDAIRKHYAGSGGWVKMDHEIAWCEETKETLYIKTEYPLNHAMRLEMIWDKPEYNPFELNPRPEVAKPVATSVPGPGIEVAL